MTINRIGTIPSSFPFGAAMAGGAGIGIGFGISILGKCTAGAGVAAACGICGICGCGMENAGIAGGGATAIGAAGGGGGVAAGATAGVNAAAEIIRVNSPGSEPIAGAIAGAGACGSCGTFESR